MPATLANPKKPYAAPLTLGLSRADRRTLLMGRREDQRLARHEQDEIRAAAAAELVRVDVVAGIDAEIRALQVKRTAVLSFIQRYGK
jgi:hypothetical protein